jgi:hypothetical protein
MLFFFSFVHAFFALASNTINAVCIRKQTNKKQRNTRQPLPLGREDDFIEEIIINNLIFERF